MGDNLKKISYFNNNIIFKDKKFYYENVELGDVYKEVDGFYVFVPHISGGSWDSWVLRKISDKLDEMNKPWKEQIERDLFGDHKEPNNTLKDAYKKYKQHRKDEGW